VLLYSVFHLFVCRFPVFGISSVCLQCSYIRYFICLFVVLLYSVFHLFVCSVPVFGISSVCLLCSCIRYFNCLFVVFLYSVFHLFVCSVSVFGISSSHASNHDSLSYAMAKKNVLGACIKT
jgi:uncharacterized Tic20 family protein